jgi:hypothetical protein
MKGAATARRFVDQIVFIGRRRVFIVVVRTGVVIQIAGRFSFRFAQRFAIRMRDLVVIGMDLVEGEKAVLVAAIFDECGL